MAYVVANIPACDNPNAESEGHYCVADRVHSGRPMTSLQALPRFAGVSSMWHDQRVER